jgi:hypothetical protein
MVTRILCRSAVLSCLFFDGVDDTETRQSRAVRSARARTAISIRIPDLAPANNAAATPMAQSINSTDSIDSSRRAFHKATEANPFVTSISRAPARTNRERLIISNDPRPQKCLAALERSAGSCFFNPQPCGISANLLVARE